MKIDSIEPNLQMRLIDMEQMIEIEPNELKREIIQERTILTASPKDLQKFIKKHIKDEGFLEEPAEYKRLEPNEPDIINKNSNTKNK